MRLFKILEKERNKKYIHKSDEYKFYLENRYLLNRDPNFVKYFDVSDIYGVICANMIIQSIMNKDKLDQIIEEEYLSRGERRIENIKQEINERIIDLPYLKFNNTKIYILFFNLNTNEIYSSNSEKMSQEPYVNLQSNYVPFIIDPFATYGVEMFESLFTKLVRIDECMTTVAFYHYDLNAILMINRQGGIDNIIYLFDKNIKRPKYGHIVERIKPVIKAYFDGNLNDFIYLLYKNELISYYVFRKICKEKNL
jgi:hypothetical protein